ncbi:MAG: Smr/MutS family protein, partial [Chloroflexi bacterium]|nr:Smr/MutS family protein [Chloroflexota bacterium]
GENLSALSEIDLALAKARYAQEIRGTNPELYSGGPPECFPLLLNARHPLLAEPVVPITVPLGPKSSILVITGPNTGGKTVALKTIGLLTLMAQAGLHIPADLGSRIRVYREVYADIGDEQSIEQSLSTFSSHMGNVIRFLREVANDSLVLLDEIGAGTDPAEGAALAHAVLTHLHKVGATTVVTTHYPELKSFAQLTPGVENACVEFDLETLAPTYHLQIGLPGQSNAFAIAERLGLPQAIIDTARQLLAPVELEMEQMLGEIKTQRREATEATRQARQALTEAETLRSQLAAELRELETQRQALLEETRQQLHDDLATARERIRTLLAEAEMGPRTPPRLRATLENLDAAAISLPAPPVGHLGPAPDLKLSQRVWVEGFLQTGELCSLPDERGEVEVQIGSMRVKVQANTLRPLADLAPSLPISTPIQRRLLPPKELDIHGLRPNEAQPAIERWLNDLYLAGLQQGRVIHGRGTGALRQAVREYLVGHPLVSAFHSAPPQEGGDGVTVVTLAD